jgi:hypothetical protein
MQTITRVLTIITLAGALMLCAAQPVHAGATCSDATLNGDFGLSLAGHNIVSSVLFAFVGTLSADGSGSFTGTGLSSRSGHMSRLTFTGKYSVKPDCIGTASLSFRPGLVIVLEFVLVDDGREALVLVADTGTVEYGTIKRISSRQPPPTPAVP